MNRSWLAVMTMAGLLGAASLALGQIPAGSNFTTFGRSGRSYPWLNGHGYNTGVPSGITLPGSRGGHAYGGVNDAGIVLPGSSGKHGYGGVSPTPGRPTGPVVSTPATGQPGPNGMAPVSTFVPQVSYGQDGSYFWTMSGAMMPANSLGYWGAPTGMPSYPGVSPGQLMAPHRGP